MSLLCWILETSKQLCAVGAAWWREGSGRVIALGSAYMFHDDWLGKQDNAAVLDFLVGWMLKVHNDLHSRTAPEPGLICHLALHSMTYCINQQIAAQGKFACALRGSIAGGREALLRRPDFTPGPWWAGAFSQVKGNEQPP